MVGQVVDWYASMKMKKIKIYQLGYYFGIDVCVALYLVCSLDEYFTAKVVYKHKRRILQKYRKEKEDQ